MKKKKRLGEILVAAGLLSEEQLQQALSDHRKANLKLGQYLVRKGIVGESKIVDLISVQLKVKKFHPADYPVEMTLAKVLPVDMARKYQVVPLKKSAFLLTIAMIDPMDIQAMDDIEVFTNLEVEAVICTEQDFNQLLNNLYGVYSGLDDVLSHVQEVSFSNDADSEANSSTHDVEVSSLQDMAEDVPVVRLVNSILSQAVREGASDVHISPEKDHVQVRFRLDGKLQEAPAPPKSMFLPIASRLKILANLDISVSRIPQDGRFTVRLNNKEVNIRVSTLPTIYGENVVLRLLDTSGGIQSPDSMGISAENRRKIEAAVAKPYGMILSTGPTGCGKTTTLYSILQKINQPDINIITLEDPVEYRIEKIRQVQLNPKAGMSFASGMRAILRQDPDVIMVGEIRDAETATIAVQAALTGHRVLSTVHTNDAAGAITRFIDMGIEPFLVSSVMLVSIAQRLVRKVCPHCRETYTPSAAALKRWGLDQVPDAEFVRGRGCFHCMDTGFKGRTGVYEVLTIDEMIQDMILKRKSAREISRAAQQAGTLVPMREDAVGKVLQGITTLEEAALAVMI
ncbi:MAG: ATPase, T2SS/T4P/T4SS family [Desulfobacterales bacterium]|nr:ATPase, T2SS/T4P/T4SS family [Desulfobacterales bacterium]